MITDVPTPPAFAAPKLAHASATFEFVVDAPLDLAAPLFGPEGERAWSGPEWDPQFIYPSSPRDVEGAVFTVSHGSTASVWVNTRFDLVNGRMQYVVLVPGAMVTTIDVALSRNGSETRAKVTYTRTALSADASEHVLALSLADRARGADWSQAIALMLKSSHRQ